MADNTQLNQNVSAGDSVRDKDRAGVKTQIVGLDLNIGGATETLMTIGQKTSANSVPVVLSSDQTVPVSGAFYQATQPISGSVSVANFPATQPVSIATNTPDPIDRAGRLLGHVTVDNASIAVTGSFYQATQPVSGTVTANAGSGTMAVSAASLPLPTGAAQDSTITGGTQKSIARGGAKGATAAADITSVAVDANTQAMHTSVTNFPASQAVTGTFFQGTQPVSIASMPSTPVTGTFWQATQPVSGTFWQVTQPISGTITSNQGTANVTPWNENVAQVNGATAVASVTGVLDVMPRKRTGATGLSPNYSASRITTKTTTTITSATCYISTIVIVVSAAGTSQTLVIQNKEATAKILVPSFTITVPATGQPIILNFNEPILATSGIDIVTAGTTAGTQDVYITYWQ